MELVTVHHMSQAEVARRFGVTDAAISQYLKRKRGDSTMIEQSENYPKLLEVIREAAEKIAEGKTEFEMEMCRICAVVKKIGLLDEIYEIHTKPKSSIPASE